MHRNNNKITRAALALLFTLPAVLTGGCRQKKVPPPETPVSESKESILKMEKTVAGHQLSYLLQGPVGEKPEKGWLKHIRRPLRARNTGLS